MESSSRTPSLYIYPFYIKLLWLNYARPSSPAQLGRAAIFHHPEPDACSDWKPRENITLPWKKQSPCCDTVTGSADRHSSGAGPASSTPDRHRTDAGPGFLQTGLSVRARAMHFVRGILATALIQQGITPQLSRCAISSMSFEHSVRRLTIALNRTVSARLDARS